MSETCGTHRKDEKRRKNFIRKTRRYETTLKTQAQNQDNIKVDIEENKCEVDRIFVAQQMDQWRTFMAHNAIKRKGFPGCVSDHQLLKESI